jgi:phosphatidylinositol alpha-1,6-mannosyltransferase
VTARVLVLSEVFRPKHGGSGRWLWEFYRRLEDVDVAVLAGPTPGAAEFDAGAPLEIARWSASFSTWGVLGPAAVRAYASCVRQTIQLARRHRADAIHCGKSLPEALVALISARRLRIPFWCYVHGEELTLSDTSRELRWLTSLVLRRAQRIVANSDNTRALVEQRLPGTAHKISVLHPAVDTTVFAPAPPDEELRRKLGWTGRPVVLTVGALQKRKGQDMLIRALPRIRAACPDVLYAMAGEGWERTYLEALVAELNVGDNVQFLGTPADGELIRLYQQCDLFALPNRQIGWDFEGFGIVLLEAQACGKPVITGASGGTAEAMRHMETGLRVPCEEPDDLASACIDLLESRSRREALGAQARAWVVERFDWRVRAREGARLIHQSPESSDRTRSPSTMKI